MVERVSQERNAPTITILPIRSFYIHYGLSPYTRSTGRRGLGARPPSDWLANRRRARDQQFYQSCHRFHRALRPALAELEYRGSTECEQQRGACDDRQRKRADDAWSPTARGEFIEFSVQAHTGDRRQESPLDALPRLAMPPCRGHPVAAGDARGNCDGTQGERPQRRVRDTDDSGSEGAADGCQAPTARTEASADQAAVDVVPTHQADGLHTATVGEAKARRQYLSTRWVRPSM